MANFPTSKDNGTSLPNPAGTDKQNSPDHGALHSTTNAAIIAVETKLGTGSSTPVVSTILFGTGTGTSAWTQLTSSQLAASLSDETGTGSAVFATTPTLVTPKVDTINESTPSNGTTIGGVNIKSGALNTNNSVVTANITNAAVTPDKLSSAAKSANVVTSESTTSTSYTGLTTAQAVTVTVGANGLLFIAWGAVASGSATALRTHISPALSGANTVAASDNYSAQFRITTSTSESTTASNSVLLTGLSTGSTTVTLQFRVTSGTGTFGTRTLSVIPL